MITLKEKKLWLLPISALVLLLSLGALYASLLKEDKPAKKKEQSAPEVVLSPLEVFEGAQKISLLGTVKSAERAELLAERSGRVKALYKKSGDYVKAGDIIAELDNADALANLQMRKAELTKAEAMLEKSLAGATESEIKVALKSKEQALSAYRAAQNALKDASISSKSEVLFAFALIDNFFKEQDGSSPKLTLPDIQRADAISVENERLKAEDNLKNIINLSEKAENFNSHVCPTDISSKISFNISKIKAFADNFLSYVRQSLTQKPNSASLKNAQDVLLSALSSLERSRQNINRLSDSCKSAEAALSLAQVQVEKVQNASRSEDVKLAKGTLELARAAYRSALVELEKRKIKAPISGTIQNLEINEGDFVLAFSPLGYLANEEKIEIELKVPSTSAEKIKIGDELSLEGKNKAYVYSISPGADSAGFYTVKAKVKGVNSLKQNEKISVEIAFAEKITNPELVLYKIPLRAILFENDKKYVILSDGEKFKKAEIVISNLDIKYALASFKENEPVRRFNLLLESPTTDIVQNQKNI